MPHAAAEPPPCSLNGDRRCVGSVCVCVCDPQWAGDECERLNLLPADPTAGLSRGLSFVIDSGAQLPITLHLIPLSPSTRARVQTCAR